MKIKTKYAIGDNIVYDDNGLKLAKVKSCKIEINCFGDVHITYNVEEIKNNKDVSFEIGESHIICKALKRCIDKQLKRKQQYEED